MKNTVYDKPTTKLGFAFMSLSKIFYLLIVLMTLQIIGCNSSEQKENSHSGGEIIHIPKDDIINIDLRDLVNKVSYIGLETTEESLISEISKLSVGDSVIMVWDKQKQAILLFNNLGNFISKIENSGKGPNEYIEISDVVLDENRKHIILLDPYSQRLQTYDYKGNIVKNQVVSDFMKSGLSFILFGDKIVFNRELNKIDEDYLGIFDLESLKFQQGIVINTIESILGGYTFPRSMTVKNDKLFFLAPGTNKIYEIDKQFNTRCIYQLNFEGHNPDYKKINAETFTSVQQTDAFIKANKYILFLQDFAITDEYIYFVYNSVVSGGVQSVFINRENGKARLASSYKGDRDQYVWGPILTTNKEGKFIGVINNLDYIFDLNITHKLRPSLDNNLQSNPILAVYDIKKDFFK